MIFYRLACDGVGCLREMDSAFGEGIQMPQGWSEFKGQVTISNGPFAVPTNQTITKHYCWDCRERMREHGFAPQETIVMGPDALPSGGPPDPLRKGRVKPGLCAECGFRWPPRARYRACPNCGELRDEQVSGGS